jgi:hypothetical protein
MHGDEESPEEDHGGHVFCNWEALESNCVGELGKEKTQVKEGCEVVELLIREVIVWKETKDGRGRNGVFVHELDCVVTKITIMSVKE